MTRAKPVSHQVYLVLADVYQYLQPLRNLGDFFALEHIEVFNRIEYSFWSCEL